MKELGSSTVPLLKPVSIPCLRVSLVTSLKAKPVIMLLGPCALLHLSKLKTERTIILLPNYLTLCPHFSHPDYLPLTYLRGHVCVFIPELVAINFLIKQNYILALNTTLFVLFNSFIR